MHKERQCLLLLSSCSYDYLYDLHVFSAKLKTRSYWIIFVTIAFTVLFAGEPAHPNSCSCNVLLYWKADMFVGRSHKIDKEGSDHVIGPTPKGRMFNAVTWYRICKQIETLINTFYRLCWLCNTIVPLSSMVRLWALDIRFLNWFCLFLSIPSKLCFILCFFVSFNKLICTAIGKWRNLRSNKAFWMAILIPQTTHNKK